MHKWTNLERSYAEGGRGKDYAVCTVHTLSPIVIAAFGIVKWVGEGMGF